MPSRPGVVARDAVKRFGHLRVGLKEGGVGDAEAKAGELLLEVLLAQDAGRPVGAAGRAVDDGVEIDRRARELGRRGDEAGLHLPGADALADDQVAKDAAPVGGLVRRQAVLARPFADLVAGRVVALGREMAVVDVDDAAPVAARVEAQGELAVGVAERVLELVAVAPLGRRRGRSPRSRSRRGLRGGGALRRPARPSARAGAA